MAGLGEAHTDTEDEDEDGDSGVHNTPDYLHTEAEASLDILTQDSLYESLKYQPGKYLLTSYVIWIVIYLNLNYQKIPTKKNI